MLVISNIINYFFLYSFCFISEGSFRVGAGETDREKKVGYLGDKLMADSRVGMYSVR